MLTADDRAQLAEHGLAAEEIERQLALFAAPPPPPRLDRPCTLGDGIRGLNGDEVASALRAQERASAADRVLKFVPASGAATRMFQALLAVREAEPGLDRTRLAARAAADDRNAAEALAFIDGIARLPFSEALRAALRRSGRDLDAALAPGGLAPVLDAVLTPAGLDLAARPKALVPFHRYGAVARSAFEEHLREAIACTAPAGAVARLHFTVSPEHQTAFAAELERIGPSCATEGRVRLEVGFSTQRSSTDTVAADAANQPLRDADGRLVLRPGGHGALIENLDALRGDVVVLKTVDNVQPEHRRAQSIEWLRVLTGHLVELQSALFAHLAALAGAAAPAAAAVAAARRFAGEVLGIEIGADADAATVAAALDRPLRVCGVVRNTGEPGGGPFWVRDPHGRCSVQIVESAQVDPRDPGQAAIFAAATHFNPVLMACGVRDWRGRPFDLHRFVDPAAVFIARKSKDGRALQALERPGLWNGAMAHWHTRFVELPLAVFTPVKTINDLLRAEHQPPA